MHGLYLPRLRLVAARVTNVVMAAPALSRRAPSWEEKRDADGRCAMAPSSFHPKKGCLVVTSNENRTAQRIHPHQEFNNGIVMSAQPLRDNQLFEVRIDKKASASTSLK
ncbi:hypothetical protein HPB49_015773 [Dermacentor silvarum]|uniref:Uncharacterized protein n=1 Tax=Dermacentor silvarum TaxID=543639 RepID=A0ACB8D630_DERSI|nr:hypothetical protein HPB49_015773 [Dermacentor silvarum]